MKRKSDRIKNVRVFFHITKLVFFRVLSMKKLVFNRVLLRSKKPITMCEHVIDLSNTISNVFICTNSKLHQAEKGARLISWFWLFVCSSKMDFLEYLRD
mmetsp:Transcript_58366/g.68167  ORF Transcript_58366/g.68167 Transcript_58366/m.68167 type:complete len:99 (+) Transcript_58366:467-763(+)